MTDTMKHFEQQTSSTLCSVLYLVHPKSSSIYFKAVDDSNLTCLLLRKKLTNKQKQNKTKQNKKKKNPNKTVKKKQHLGQVFQSVTSFET